MMLSPKILEDVRLKNHGNTQLKNITEEVTQAEDSQSMVKPPPNSFRIYNIFHIILDLSHSLVKTSSAVSNSAWSITWFYINHFILLSIFFLIAVYKNFQYIYRRLYLKYLTLTYYPSKSPQVIREDVNRLTKIPKILSCLLDLKDDDDENGGKEGLIASICELAAWSLSAGIGKLIVYEFTGCLCQTNDCIADVKKEVTKTLTLYFGTDTIPTFSVRVPHKNMIIYSDSYKENQEQTVDLEIDLISRVDGKPTVVELTKTMSELAANHELLVKDITIDLIDEELRELVGPEPDLLISFAPSLNLEDYPPWQIRLSEIYWEPDNKDVNYAVFLRGLQQFSNCKIKIGK
ncbi:Dehydrodolichyl diphosphate synthase complex subunit NUS1 [Candida viswanathii]|uniref:ditrans,polycis-polyprenyl diphosphate synthase [(2E,6E)-farnesyldiphosphate specific] n=1 Tax=Candida viswanathii TaxID=5486 RepID=A0A367YF75_9ASCO|nr:Dehydrodolichyl diphosphate synthase complex subunit NUS1 [Candida viswanathii]